MFPADQLEGSCQSKTHNEVSCIYAEHHDFLMSVLNSNISNLPDADVEDLFQDFFVSLIQRPVPTEVKCLKSFLYRAIKNDIRDQFRKTKTQQSPKPNPEVFRKKLDYQTKLQDPVKQLEYREIRQYIEVKINRNLPRYEANAVKEKLLLESSVTEGAKNLNIEKRSFSRYTCLGLKRLRRLLPDLQR